MCGIAICVSTDSILKEKFSAQARKCLQHRGPDGEGTWMDDHIVLAHTRLAIQDLSEAGHQPMASSCGRYYITFNGEIYNHLDLRKQFLNDEVFVGHSDTETILSLYKKMGVRMLDHMVGMWAFGIWDVRDKTLLISRDRFGQKPLYWTNVGYNLFFSSQLSVLRAERTETINLLAVSEYLGLGNYGHLFEQTFEQEIYQVLPGHYSIYNKTGKLETTNSYWNIEEVAYNDRRRLTTENATEFRGLVINAVQSQLLSDVPVGATLSGGLDSSIIVSCIAELGLRNFPVFTAQFPGSLHDESRYVEAIKKRFGNAIEVIYAPVQELSLQSSLKEVLMEQEEPFGDPSIMAHGFLVRAAKQAGVPVLLGGQGGDEISLGYPWMFQRAFGYALHNGDLRSFLSFMKNSGISTKEGMRLMLAALNPKIEHWLRMRVRSNEKRRLSNDLQIPSPGGSFGKIDHFNEIYLESVKTVGIPHLCHYDDRSTMAQSIEGRMPFLDHRLLEYVSEFRPDAFYENGYSKSIFRKAFVDMLPKEILERRDKVGFYTPLLKFINADRAWIKNVIEKNDTLAWISVPMYNRLNKVLGSELQDNAVAIFIFRLLSLIIWNSTRQNKEVL